MTTIFTHTIDNSRSYATHENLEKALVKLGVTRHDRPIAVRTTEGRWTAIFPAPRDGDVTKFSRLGFMTIG